jgi:hypothetical protein
MNPRRYLPSRRHPAHSATAERVPLPRPNPDSDSLDDWPPSRAECEQTPADWQPAPPRRYHFIPRPREDRSGQQPGLDGAAAPGPQPRFIPLQQPAGDGLVPGPGGYAAAIGPLPPAPPWRPPTLDRPQQGQAIERPSPVRALERPQQEQASERRQPLRAVIGDEIRIPILWCEFGRCIERYTHADALGERDLRVRAYEAGWRYDALWRLACPSCVQCDASFWANRLPVLFCRD